MISEEAASAEILKGITALPSRLTGLADALGCFAAEEISARFALPMFDNSAMDGYAIVAGPGKHFRVVGEQPAGPDRGLRVELGEAVRIFTGAPVPAGANAVVMQEDVTREGDQIVVNGDVAAGEFIRRRGSDLAAGQKMIGRGERISAAKLALLASQGVAELKIGGEAGAAVISTGDELATPGAPLKPGEIYDSNSFLLRALLQRAGAVVRSAQHCPDNLERLIDSIRAGTRQHVLVISGGVSVGEHDLVRRALETLGARIEIWRVAIKPGKPFLFGRLDHCAIFGLPGNPVSSFVTFLRFVRPAVMKLMGAGDLEPARTEAKLSVDLTNDDVNRPHYFRGRLADGKFIPVGRQESHALFGLAQSNALARVAAGCSVKAGDRMTIEILD